MKTYFMRCSKAKESQLLKRLDCFPHFKDGAKRFSLVDLKTVHSGELLKELTVIHREFAVHIKKDCTVSREKIMLFFLILRHLCIIRFVRVEVSYVSFVILEKCSIRLIGSVASVPSVTLSFTG